MWIFWFGLGEGKSVQLRSQSMEARPRCKCKCKWDTDCERRKGLIPSGRIRAPRLGQPRERVGKVG